MDKIDRLGVKCISYHIIYIIVIVMFNLYLRERILLKWARWRAPYPGGTGR